MQFVGGCRFENGVTSCRHIEVQKAMLAARMEQHTTRLSEKKMPGLSSDGSSQGNGLTFSELSRNNVPIVKGLFVQHDVLSYACDSSQPLIVFGKPVIHGQQFDYQHMNLAMSLRLTENVPLPRDRAVLLGRNFERGLAKGVSGFTISPIRFSAGNNISQTKIKFPTEKNEVCEILVDAQAEEGLLDQDSGEVDLEKVQKISQSTAKQLWNHYVYALLFRAAPERDREIWAVSTVSAAGGKMKKDAVVEFLNVLARHVAPEFKVFRFLRIGDVFQRNLIGVSWARAKRPNCLYWPRGYRLCRGPAPEDWWGERV